MIYTHLGPNEAYEIDFIIEYEMMHGVYPDWHVAGVDEVRVQRDGEFVVVKPNERGMEKIRKIAGRLNRQAVIQACCLDRECIAAKGDKEYIKEDYE